MGVEASAAVADGFATPPCAPRNVADVFGAVAFRVPLARSTPPLEKTVLASDIA